MERTRKTIETNRNTMNLFDLRNHLINHYRKLNTVSSVVDSNCGRGRRVTARGRTTTRTRFNARPLDAASRSVSKSISSLPSARPRRRHDCLTPNEKLTTYRSRSETGRAHKKAELPPASSSTNCQSKNGDNFHYRSRSRSGTAKSETTADEHDYAHFAWLITEDILHNQLFEVEQIEHVFRSHVAANRDRLNFHRMHAQIDNLRRILNLDDSRLMQSEPSSTNTDRNDVLETPIGAKSTNRRDVAVSCRIDQKSIGVMTSPVPQERPQLPKCDKQVNTSNIPSPVVFPTVQNSSSQTEQLPQPPPQPLSIFQGSSVSKSADYPPYYKRSMTVAATKTTTLTNGDTFITNWPMMKKYQLTGSAPDRTRPATLADLDAYSSRKRKSTTPTATSVSASSRSGNRAFDPLALSDGEIVLTSISSLTISVTEDELRTVSSSNSSDSSVS